MPEYTGRESNPDEIARLTTREALRELTIAAEAILGEATPIYDYLSQNDSDPDFAAAIALTEIALAKARTVLDMRAPPV